MLSEAIYSSIMNVRIMAARMLFNILMRNLTNPQSINSYLNENVQNMLRKSVLFLAKLKVSTYRQLAIKLSSLVLYCKSDSQAAIEYELIKILATE